MNGRGYAAVSPFMGLGIKWDKEVMKSEVFACTYGVEHVVGIAKNKQ